LGPQKNSIKNQKRKPLPYIKALSRNKALKETIQYKIEKKTPYLGR
jgi:hypothetical protein